MDLKKYVVTLVIETSATSAREAMLAAESAIQNGQGEVKCREWKERKPRTVRGANEDDTAGE